MRHTNRTEQMNHDHFAKVIVARNRHNDIEDAKVIAYMDRAVAQAEAQIQSLSKQATDKVNKTFKQRFLEAL
jgi:F420-0:gamma-glutamyl ligase